MDSFADEVPYRAFQEGASAGSRKSIIAEAPCTLVVDSQEWITILCTPTDLEELALGFLFDAGVVERADDVRELRLTEGPEGLGALIGIALREPLAALPARPTLTSGCSGGVTFYDLAVKRSPLTSDTRVSAQQVYDAMAQLMAANVELHREIGGFHSSGLSDGYKLLVVAHDIGRHNTIDKIAGAALRGGIATDGCMLVTTGRISAEMLAKAARLRVPIVASRNSPTSLAVQLANEWRITVAGYVRGKRMRVYAADERIALAVTQKSPSSR